MVAMVDLGERLEAVVAKGRYSSRDKALQESVRLLEERERKRATLYAALDKGLEDIRAGRTRPAEDVFDELEAKLEAMAKARGL